MPTCAKTSQLNKLKNVQVSYWKQNLKQNTNSLLKTVLFLKLDDLTQRKKIAISIHLSKETRLQIPQKIVQTQQYILAAIQQHLTPPPSQSYGEEFTVIKNRPSNNPRYGAISDSTWRANSVSANNKPARKAPSAIDKPAWSKMLNQVSSNTS